MTPELQLLLKEHITDMSEELPEWLQTQLDKLIPSAQCNEPKVELEATAGSKVTVTWVFENNGEITWPNEIYFKQICGYNEGYEQKITDINIEVGAQLTISADIKVPVEPGFNSLLFRLAYSEDRIQFGDEVFLNLISKEEDELKDTPADTSYYFWGLTSLFSGLTGTNQETPQGEEQNDDDNYSSNELNLSQSSWQIVADHDADEGETPAGIAEPKLEEEATSKVEEVDVVLKVEEDETVPSKISKVEEEEEVAETVEVTEAADKVEEAAVVEEEIENPYLNEIEEDEETGELDQQLDQLTPEQREKQIELCQYN